MDATDLITYFRNYCKDNNIYFAPGETHYANYLGDIKLYEAYGMILCCDLRMSPEFGEDGIQSVVYNGTISLGRKREECTESNLDEVFLDKYDNRLKSLTDILLGMFQTMICQEEVEVVRCDIGYILNSLDVNIDFVSANVAIRVPYVEV